MSQVVCYIRFSNTQAHAHMHKITHQRIYKTRDKFMQVYREMNYIMLDTFMYDLHITCMNIFNTRIINLSKLEYRFSSFRIHLTIEISFGVPILYNKWL